MEFIDAGNNSTGPLKSTQEAKPMVNRHNALGRRGLLAGLGTLGVPAIALGRSPQVEVSGYRFLVKTCGAPWSFNYSNGVYRFEVRAGDVVSSDTPNHERSELNHIGSIDEGRNVQLQFKMLIEPGPTSTARFVVLGQFHHIPDEGDQIAGPPLAQYLDAGDAFRIQSQSFAQRPITGRKPRVVHFRQARIQRNEWIKLRYDIKFDPYGAGQLKVWMNDSALVNYAGPIGYLNKAGPSPQIGIYRSAAFEPLAVRYADIVLTQ